METFTAIKNFVDNPHFSEQRQRVLRQLDISTIDAPIIELIDGFSHLPYCFTLQSCYGHFLHTHQRDPQNLEPLPLSESLTHVEYRIAYVALCLQDSELGRSLFGDLKEIPGINPEYIQLGCAEWFWERQVNSYALQVEPKRHTTRDKISVPYQEALHIEKIRDKFFRGLEKIIQQRTH